MTEDLVEPTLVHDMDDEEAALAADCYAAVQALSAGTDRAKQAMEFKVGVSDLGFCSERVRRTLLGMIPEHTDMLAAFAGQCLGDGMELAYKRAHPAAMIQAPVVVTLNGERNLYTIPGHPDVIDPAQALVIDFKTDRGLGVVRRTGPNLQQTFQKHLYALGAWDAGFFGQDIALSDVKVANVWMDRACDEHVFHAHVEPFDMRVVEEAARWLDEVVYAWQHDQEARKEPPREVCAVTCGFYATCRAWDTDVEGRLSDDRVLTAVDMYDEGRELAKRGRMLQDQAKASLDGIVGSTGEFTVRWVWVNETEVPATVRRGYNRLDIRKVK